ncbi:unnamed protein product [Aureobasidium mustum]|uniref:Uncharacterized protein n=1 Tax=Aureobasidium mustum TaxID=2773714 RepID=A0A9N8K4Z2_9PEZI|nr:unnamed protein product [Aureobasidium mustum]
MAERYTLVTEPQLIIDQDTVVQNNTHMTRFGDSNFCVWVMKQLNTVGRWHMVEPFVRLPGQMLDVQTINQRLHSGGYPDAATLQQELLSIPTNWLKNNSGQNRRHAKANDLLLELPALFRSRNRVDNAHRRSQQQQQPPTGPSVSASANTNPGTAGNAASGSGQNPAQGSAQVSVQDSAQNAAQGAAAAAATAQNALSLLSPAAASQPPVIVTRELSIPIRLSAPPPGSSRKPNSHSERRPVENRASNTGTSEYSFGRDIEDALREGSEEASEHSSALHQARAGKKRAASGDNIGTDSKRVRQETPKYKYRYVLRTTVDIRLKILTNRSELRVEIAGVFDREMELVHSGGSSIELAEGAQRYVDHVSQMDARAMEKARKVDLNGIKEDCVEELEKLLVEAVQEHINKVLASKGQYIHPRVSLSSKMEDEEEDNNDQEHESKAKVKRE